MDKDKFEDAVQHIAIRYASAVLAESVNGVIPPERCEEIYHEVCDKYVTNFGNLVDGSVRNIVDSVLRDVDNWETHHMISGIVGIYNVSDDQVIRFMVNTTVGTRYNVPVVSHSIDLKTGIVYKDDMGKEIGRIIDGKLRRT